MVFQEGSFMGFGMACQIKSSIRSSGIHLKQPIGKFWANQEMVYDWRSEIFSTENRLNNVNATMMMYGGLLSWLVRMKSVTTESDNTTQHNQHNNNLTTQSVCYLLYLHLFLTRALR